MCVAAGAWRGCVSCEVLRDEIVDNIALKLFAGIVAYPLDIQRYGSLARLSHHLLVAYGVDGQCHNLVALGSKTADGSAAIDAATETK